MIRNRINNIYWVLSLAIVLTGCASTPRPITDQDIERDDGSMFCAWHLHRPDVRGKVAAEVIARYGLKEATEKLRACEAAYQARMLERKESIRRMDECAQELPFIEVYTNGQRWIQKLTRCVNFKEYLDKNKSGIFAEEPITAPAPR